MDNIGDAENDLPVRFETHLDATVTEPTAAALSLSDLDDKEAVWMTPVVERRDLELEFMLIIVLPLVLALVLFLIFAYAMFGRREGVEKRDQMTPEQQMVQFNSIRRATTNLRLMSTQRHGQSPLSVSTPSMHRNSVQPQPLRPATLPRNSGSRINPPPYSSPPSYSSQSHTMPNPKHGASTSVFDDEITLDDNQHLVNKNSRGAFTWDNTGMY